MAATQHTVTITGEPGAYGWTRKANNGATIARSHRTWPTPKVARTNAEAVNATPYTLHATV